MVKRRKLFSTASSAPLRRKLFGTTPGQFICMDCGYLMTTAETTTNLVCPKCGGRRFNVAQEQKSFSSRKSLFGEDVFQKQFSEPSNDFEKNLKLYSEKILSGLDVERYFSTTSEDMVNSGYAEYTGTGNNVKIYDTAFLQSKMFSKMIISVTKILDLDKPAMTQPREVTIDSLASRDSLSPKGIILIKKAHGIPNDIIGKDMSFSETPESTENWVKDSGIIGDLEVEFGGSRMSIKEFMNILNERYSDAPEDLIDYLVSHGKVVIQGNQVDILK